MALQVVWSCPTCGLALLTVDLNWKSNQAADRENHLHLEVNSGVKTCLNGHSWRMDGDMIVKPV